MYGSLVPSSGGQTLPLRKTRMYLGRVKGDDAPLSRENAFCQLELIEGFWHVEDLNTPNGVKVNGRAIKRERLMPDDEIAIGKHRYRISFESPKYVGKGKLAKASRSSQSTSASLTAGSTTGTGAPQSGGILGRLVPVGGGEDIPLTKPRIIIGRKPPCDVVLPYKSISSMHCGLELIDGYWKIRDLDSRNGVRVGGESVKTAWVMPRDRFALAEHRFQLDYVGSGDLPEEIAQEREASVSSDRRSFMEKVGLSDQEVDRIHRSAAIDETEQRKRWNVFNNE